MSEKKEKPWGQRKLEEWFGKDNPLMPSKEKEQIKALDEEERLAQRVREAQESGENYPAKWHVKKPE